MERYHFITVSDIASHHYLTPLCHLIHINVKHYIEGNRHMTTNIFS
jgi:hypothetical protein